MSEETKRLVQERVGNLRQNKMKYILIIIVFLLAISQPIFASGKEISREEILSHLQKAFEAQVSLTEKPRTKEQIRDILSPYFEQELIEKYMANNVNPFEEKFIVYGTDFPYYTIPFFTYDHQTIVYQRGDKFIVYEHFPKSDGPVSYDDHYELVKLTKTDEGWKVNEIHTDIKKIESILNENEKKDAEAKQSVEPNKTSTSNQMFNYSYLKKVTFQILTNELRPIYVPSFYLQTKTLLRENVQL
jgi:hypothetical protein